MPRAERAAAVARALGIANLEPRADTIVRELSGGMRRRLLVARGLIHHPRLVLLDEPTVRLDPQVRQELWSLIDGLRAEGVTVLMSTHYIEEAERLADSVAVMSAGRIIAQGTPAELVGAHAGREVIEVYGPPAEFAELEVQAAANGWRHRPSGPSVALGWWPPRSCSRRHSRACSTPSSAGSSSGPTTPCWPHRSTWGS